MMARAAKKTMALPACWGYLPWPWADELVGRLRLGAA